MSRNKKLRLLGAIFASILCGIIYFTLSLKVVSWWTEPYQLLNTMDYKCTPAAPLFTFLSHIWGLFFGFSIKSMKMLAVIISYLTLIIPTLFMYYKKRNLTQCLYTISICSILSIMIPHIFAFGWDVFSNLFLVSVLICFLLYIEKRSIFLLCFLSVLLAFAVLSRCPNVVIFFVFSIYFFITKQFKHLILFILSTAAVYYITIIVIYGSLTNYITYWQEYGVVNGHSFKTLLGSYIYGAIKISAYIIAFIIAMWSTKQRPILLRRFVLILLSVSIFINLYIYAVPGWQTTINNTYSSLLISILIYIVYTEKDIKNALFNKQIIHALSILVISLSPCIGSDTGLVKMMSLPLIPIVFTLYNYKVHKDILIFVIISLVCFYPIYFYRNLKEINTTLNLPKIGAVTTTKNQAIYLTEVYNDINKYSDLLVVGAAERYIFELLYGKRIEYSTHSYNVHLNDSIYVEKTFMYIQQNAPNNVIVVSSNESTPNNSTTMDTMLICNDYKLLSYRNRYRVYEKNH